MAKKKIPRRPRKSPPARTAPARAEGTPQDGPPSSPSPRAEPGPAPGALTGDPEGLLRQVDTLVRQQSPALAWKTARQFLGMAPGHPRAAEIRALESRLRAWLEQETEAAGLPREAAWEVLPHHEMVRGLRDCGRTDDARLLAERVAERWDYLPLLQTLSQLQWDCCEPERAIATTRRILQRKPDHLHALTGLVRLLACSGDSEGATRCARHVRDLPCRTPDSWVRKAEALDDVDDHRGVLAVFGEADLHGLQHVEQAGTLCHLAAASALLLGEESRARRLWKQAFQRSPDLAATVRANQADLARPRHQRHAPWVYSLGEWLPRQASRELGDLLRATSDTSEEEIDEALREFARRRPLVLDLLPRLLRRGDESARRLALVVASMKPEYGPMLRDVALGQDGPDVVRLAAARAAARLGAMDTQPVPMWLEGAWKKVVFFSFEIDTVVTRRHEDPTLDRGQREALEQAEQGHLPQAEAMFRALLEKAPGAPDLEHNLACTLAQQGRHEEARDILHRVRREHPAYVFAAINLAHMAMERNDVDSARQLVTPLLRLPRMHSTEVMALCQVQQEICRVQGRLDDARAWKDWETRFERETLADEG